MMEIDFSKENFQNILEATDFERKVSNFLLSWFSDEKTVNVQTSGSTGIPKVFAIEKERMLDSAKMTCDFLGLKSGDSALLCLPVEYISGKMMVVRALERKLKLHISNPSVKPLENLQSEVDFCAMTPLQVENSLKKIYLIKNLIIGGASVAESLKKKIHKHLDAENQNRVFETYGMSETLSHIALKEIFPNAESYFTVFDNVEISTDERGCLQIFAPKLNSELLQTNDLVELKNEKEFRFLGRIDNVINSGGAKVFPEELEVLVKSIIDLELVFIGISNETLGQKLVLVIEGKEDKSITNRINELPFEKSFHRPKEIIFVEKIPRTPNGKIDRRALVQELSQ